MTFINTTDEAAAALTFETDSEREAFVKLITQCQTDPDFGDAVYALSQTPIPSGVEFTEQMKMTNLWAAREFRLRNTARPVRKPIQW